MHGQCLFLILTVLILTGAEKIVCVAFNPEVLKMFGIHCKDLPDRNLLINLAIDFIEDRNKLKLSRNFTLLNEDHVIHGCPDSAKQSLLGKFTKKDEEFEADLGAIQEKFGPMASGCKESLLSELTNISSSGPGSNEAAEITLNTSTTPSRQGLIEEVSSLETALAEPHFDIETRGEDKTKPRRLVVRVDLPTVITVAECDLNISEVSDFA